MLAGSIAVQLVGGEAVKTIVEVATICTVAVLMAYKITLDKGYRLEIGQFIAEPVR